MSVLAESPIMTSTAITLSDPLPVKMASGGFFANLRQGFTTIEGLVAAEQCVITNSLPDEFPRFVGRTIEASLTTVSSTFYWKAGPLEKARKLIQLIDQWIQEGPVCDDATWKAFQQDIENNRLSYRKRFSE